MADDEGRGNVLDLPLVRLFAPPEARPPEGLTSTPAGTMAAGFPALPAAAPAVPPESLTLPAAVVPAGDDDSPAATMFNRAVDPNASRVRNATATAMVVAAAIAVACLRGTFGVVEYVRARAEHHRAVRDKAGSGAKASKTPTPRIPAGPEFGRGAVGNRQPKGGGSSLGSRSSGAGGRSPGSSSGGKGRQGGMDGRSGGRKGSGGSSLADAAKEARKKAKRDAAARERERAAKDKPGKDGRASAGAGAAAGPKSPKSPKPEKSPKPKKDQGGSLAPVSNTSDKTKKSGGGKGRTLPQAVGDEAARRAKKRLKKRRKKLQPVVGKDTTPKEKKGKESGDQEPESPKVDLRKKSPKGAARRTHTPGGGPGARPWRGRTKPTRPKKKRRRSGRHTRADRPWENREGARDMPNPDGEWLRPPPGWTVTTSYTVTQDGPTQRHPWPEPAAVTAGVRGLPRAPDNGAGPRPGTTRPIPMPTAAPAPTARPAGGRMATAPVKTTQFTDSDLTVYDVIDSDADMAEEILAGAEHAKQVADRCERLTATLEALRAELLAKKVPGVLIGWTARLIESSGVVQGKAEGLAAALPRASEAISTAGQRAADADQHRADAVRDAGHAAPAEREYHQE